MSAPENTNHSTPKVRQPRIVNFTDSAAKKVAGLIREEENLDLKLRAFITGGGCSGFQYGFTFDEKIKDGDTQVQKTVLLDNEVNEPEDVEPGSGVSSNIGGQEITVTLLIDPMSYQYLVGADIDYKEDIEGARFVIRNPNAKTTCGCGQSFSI